MLYHFLDKARYRWKIAIFSYALALDAPVMGGHRRTIVIPSFLIVYDFLSFALSLFRIVEAIPCVSRCLPLTVQHIVECPRLHCISDINTLLFLKHLLESVDSHNIINVYARSISDS